MLLLLGSVHAFSEDSGERKVIEELTPPWGAVGQVNVAGYRQRVECTGSLVAPNIVLTAAHCVTDPSHRKPFPVDEIHFLAGVRGSTWLRHSTAKCVHFPLDYDYGSQSFSKDLVLITLNDNFNDIVAMDLDRTDAQGSDISFNSCSVSGRPAVRVDRPIRVPHRRANSEPFGSPIAMHVQRARAAQF